MRDIQIYTLSDPVSGDVRYVGYAHDTRRRLWEHVSRAMKNRESTWKARWIRKLAKAGREPVMTIIETARECDRQDRERWWIGHYRSIGCNLTNCTDGGDGACGWKPTPEQIEKWASKIRGRKFTDEHRANLSKAFRGRKCSDDARKRMSESHKGKTMPREAIAKTVAFHTGRKRSDETRKKLRSRWEARRSNIFPGVRKDKNRWRAEIFGRDGKKYLGLFLHIEDAAMAYAKAYEQEHGDNKLIKSAEALAKKYHKQRLLF